MKKARRLVSSAVSMLCALSLGARSDVVTPASSPLHDLSRRCIKIWCLMRNLVDDKEEHPQALAEAESVEYLDTLLCKIVRVREMIKEINSTSPHDSQTADYVDSSLDCIESYTYDLLERYPGSWSTIIQEQVFRAQEEYARSVWSLTTK